MPHDNLEQRIRQKAHELWEQDGRPEGRAAEHWEKARILVAIEEDQTSLVPVATARPEEAELQNNLGEFPTAFTDAGDRPQTPSRAAKRGVAQSTAAKPRAAAKRKRK
jgi:hypothetical protein